MRCIPPTPFKLVTMAIAVLAAGQVNAQTPPAATARPAISTVSASSRDALDITTVMKKQFDRPDAPLKVMPVSVVQDYALAGWMQGDKGGRALLQKLHGQWLISVCGGSGLTQAKVLETTGMHAAAATKLAEAARLAEAKLSPQQRRLMDSFEGMLNITPGQAEHGQHKAQDAHKAHVAPPQ